MFKRLLHWVYIVFVGGVGSSMACKPIDVLNDYQ